MREGVLLREFKSEILLVAFGNFTSWREISPSIQTLTKLLNFKVVLAHFALKVYREIPGTLLKRTGNLPVHSEDQATLTLFARLVSTTFALFTLSTTGGFTGPSVVALSASFRAW